MSAIATMNLPKKDLKLRETYRAEMLGRAWCRLWRAGKDTGVSPKEMMQYTRWRDRWIWASTHLDREQQGELEHARVQTAGVILLDLIGSGRFESEW